MATETSGSHPSGAAAEVKDKGVELVSAAQEQMTAKAHELGGEANVQIRAARPALDPGGRTAAVDREDPPVRGQPAAE